MIRKHGKTYLIRRYAETAPVLQQKPREAGDFHQKKLNHHDYIFLNMK
jgi:hypothetical protein